ncbi:MAG: hypothetical protein QF596_03685 [Acidimicrobiales bacterium]|jgi:hypothetical protein|nr:hypothetical protein [Acidimicrobiales bacterium]MDP6298504.1 hypothetical protein [Acidimicrobiales bacterium]HJM28722.1 hypothetical protein [Acidimicrobiales bacterium]HJM96799.1 hypothetical protein [Acidimicrobiales bacterium]
MAKIIPNVIITIFLSVGIVIANALSAFAQIIESDIDSEPGTNETIQRITSTFEVKRAVIGLLVIAAIAGVTFFFYWYKTGQWARERHAQQHGVNKRMKKRYSKPKTDAYFKIASQKKNKSSKPFRRNRTIN